jgi:HAE1 family hydrophobic/amphiphilic exporter-1
MRSYNVTPGEVSAASKYRTPNFPAAASTKARRKPASGRWARSKSRKNSTTWSSRPRHLPGQSKRLGYTEDGGEELRSEARLNGQPAVTLIVSKQSGQNTVAVAHEINGARLKEIEPTLPKGYQMRVIGDNSIFIEKLSPPSRNTSYWVLFWHRSWYSSFLMFSLDSSAALAIPTSIISTFALVYAMGLRFIPITMLGPYVDGRYRYRRRDRCT